MKRFLSVFAVSLFLWPASCAPAGDEPTGKGSSEEMPGPEGDAGGSSGEDTGGSGNESDRDDNEKEPTMTRKITLQIGAAAFTATLTENAAADALLEMLPLTLDMSELNGNEKYANLDRSLPVDTYRPGTIEAGDLLLWGDNCVVLFYETFSSGYSYTRLGRIDNPAGLAEAVGRGGITVRWERN